jgi:hypothetical protein
VAKPIFPGYSPEQLAVVNRIYAPQGGAGIVPTKGVDRPPNPHAFTPYSPPPIPSGYYDPSLDAQRDAASRGLLNTEQDIGLAGRRAGEDYGLDPNDPTYGYSAVGTIDRNYGRDTADLATARSNEGVDYGRNVEKLTRSYQQLGRQQGEQARKYGVTSGGIALLSAAKRAENEALGQARHRHDAPAQRHAVRHDRQPARRGSRPRARPGAHDV